MAAGYTIYLVNQGATPQTFWCFVAPAQELAADSGVFANSNVSLTVFPNGNGSFVLPLQYSVAAGASTSAVSLGIQIMPGLLYQAALGDLWQVAYSRVPLSPMMQPAGSQASPNSIAIATNAFDRSGNEANSWFASQSFGIQTDQGFIGMSWSPAPQQTRNLTPNLTFYVTTGSFGSNQLAQWDAVSNAAAQVRIPNDFQGLACTVTLSPQGTWSVMPGSP